MKTRCDRYENFKRYAENHREEKRIWRRKSESRPEYKAKRKVYLAEWARKNKDRLALYRKRNRHKHRARYKLLYAVKVGHIKRLPCEVCGKIKSEAHHTDYDRPLDVKWLCRRHHAVYSRKS